MRKEEATLYRPRSFAGEMGKCGLYCIGHLIPNALMILMSEMVLVMGYGVECGEIKAVST